MSCAEADLRLPSGDRRLHEGRLVLGPGPLPSPAFPWVSPSPSSRCPGRW